MSNWGRGHACADREVFEVVDSAAVFVRRLSQKYSETGFLEKALKVEGSRPRGLSRATQYSSSSRPCPHPLRTPRTAVPPLNKANDYPAIYIFETVSQAKSLQV